MTTRTKGSKVQFFVSSQLSMAMLQPGQSTNGPTTTATESRNHNHRHTTANANITHQHRWHHSLRATFRTLLACVACAHTYIHIYKYVCVCACGCAQRSITSLLCCRWPVNWRKSSKTHKKVCKAQQQFVWLHRNYNNTTIQIKPEIIIAELTWMKYCRNVAE